jgi:hypothetical protein
VSRVFVALLVGLCLCGVDLQRAWSQASPSEAVAKSIDEIGKTPWFDPETDSVLPVPLRERQRDTLHRDSRWLPGAKKVAKSSTTASSSSSSSSSGGWFNTGVTTGHVIGWLILGAMLLGLAMLLLYAFSKISPADVAKDDHGARGGGLKQDEQLMRRIKELPAELRRTDVDLRTEAERLMKLGELDEAIKCLFGHQLLLLDRRGALRLARGKTNGRYVSETRRELPEAAGLLRETVAAFEASYFGRHSPTVETFRSLWMGNEQLEQLARATTEAGRT